MEERGRSRIAELLDELTEREGTSRSALAQVRLIRITSGSPRAPNVYEPSVIIVGQGRKIGYLGDEVYIYDPNNYLVLSVPLPFECETVAEPGTPFLAVSITMEAAVIAELISELETPPGPGSETPRGIYSNPLRENLANATVRLLECLKAPRDAAILGPQILREITYYVLTGEGGPSLRAVVAHDTRFAQLSRVLRRIHAEYDRDLDVRSMAEEANLSVSAFHRYFKELTNASPLQYLKSIRLHNARLLLLQEELGVSGAAERVGYASVSQFSREFKRYYGESPSEVGARLHRAS